MVKIREETAARFSFQISLWLRDGRDEAMVQITSLKKLFWQFFPCFFTFLFCFASAWCRTEQQKLSKLFYVLPTFPVITRKRRTARQDNDLKLHVVIVIYDQASLLPKGTFSHWSWNPWFMNGTLKKRLKNHEDTRRMTEKNLRILCT